MAVSGHFGAVSGQYLDSIWVVSEQYLGSIGGSVVAVSGQHRADNDKQ